MSAHTSDVLFLDLESGPSACMNGTPTMTPDICMTIRTGFGLSSCVVATPMSPPMAQIALDSYLHVFDRQITSMLLPRLHRELSRFSSPDPAHDAGGSGLETS
jgi:hypothetical protein